LNKDNAQAAIRRAAQEVIAAKMSPAQQQVRVQIQQQLTSSPLPPPEVLIQYNQAVPSGAERIMQMAEREQKHVHVLQNWSAGLMFLGELFGWSIIVLAMVGAFYLVLKDKRLEGAASFLSALAILAAGWYSRWKEKREVPPPQPSRQPTHQT
jgi:uncharacterized membrane protein